MKTIVWMLVMMMCAAGSVSAETVFLKNGSQITGAIIARDGDKVQLDISGVTITYYMDEVDRIEAEKPVVSSSEAGKPKAAVKTVNREPEPIEEQVAEEYPYPGTVQEDDALERMSKRELILEFLRVFGTRRSMEENFQQILAQLPVEQALELGQVLRVEAVLEELIPIYDQYFSKEELIVYIRFYETPEGQKLVASIPKIMQASIKQSANFLKKVVPAPPTR